MMNLDIEISILLLWKYTDAYTKFVQTNSLCVCKILVPWKISLQWRHNRHDGVSNR